MEENTTVQDVTEVTEPIDGAETVNTEPATTEVKTFTQEEFDKRLQSETDKIRGKYAKQTKALEDKIRELSPVELSPVEQELQNRLAELENRQRELDEQKAHMDLQTTLTNAGLSRELANFIKGDANVEDFVKMVDVMVKERTVAGGYQPQSHTSNDGVTQEQWKKCPIPKGLNSIIRTLNCIRNLCKNEKEMFT